MGTTMEKFVKGLMTGESQATKTQLIALGKNSVLIQELKSGRMDAVVVEDVQAIEFVKANAGLGSKVIETGAGDGYAVAFPKEKNKDLKASFDQALAKVRASGALDQLRKKWIEGK